MGPRPFGRGMLSLAHLHKRASHRFNGAATFRSRNGDWDMADTDEDWMLQWGRDLSVAECVYLIECPTCGHELQWGRDLSVAECEGAAPAAKP